MEIDPEYQLIVEANNLTVEIDNEIGERPSCEMRKRQSYLLYNSRYLPFLAFSASKSLEEARRWPLA